MHPLKLAQAYVGGGGRRPSLSFRFINGTIVSTRGGVTPTFTRATTKLAIDWEGAPRLLLSGEVPFDGLRRVQNRVLGSSEDFSNANWSVLAASKTGATTIDGVACMEMNFTASSNAALFQSAAHAVTGRYAIRAYVRAKTAPVTLRLGYGGTVPGDHSADFVVPTAWTWIGGYSTADVASGSNFSIRNGSGGALCDFYVAKFQFEDVTGQSNFNPSEYVSLGVLASPWNGANVDGVKWFNTLNGNTVSGNVVTEATGAAIPLGGVGIGWSPLVGTFSTPDSVAISAPGDMRLEAWFGIADWTPAALGMVYGQWGGAGNRSHRLILNAAGTLNLQGTADGTNNICNATSSVSVPFTDGTAGYIGFTRNATTGDVVFLTSLDGVTWTQLGTTQVSTAGAFFDSTQTFAIGAQDSGGTNALVVNSFYRLRMWKALVNSGTPALDFSPTNWTAGATFLGTTGETWTLNGGAKVNKWPVQGYSPNLAATNLCLQSENFGTTWVAVGTPTRSAAALRNGVVLLDLIGDDDGAGLEGYTQVVTYTADATKAFSLYFAQGTSTSTVFRIRDTTAAADRLLGAITWVNGFPTVTMTTGTLQGVDARGNGVFRLRVLSSAITAANVNQLECYPATDAALAVAATGTVYFGAVMTENAAVSAPYIATTTATVTVNKDDMAVTSLGSWYSALAGTVVVRFVAGKDNTASRYVGSFNDTTTNETISFILTAAPAAQFFVADGAATQANIAGGVPAANTAGALGYTWAANDFAEALNGAIVGTDVVGTLPTATRLDIGNERGSAQFSGGVRTFDYYPTRVLPDASFAALAV